MSPDTKFLTKKTRLELALFDVTGRRFYQLSYFSLILFALLIMQIKLKMPSLMRKEQ